MTTTTATTPAAPHFKFAPPGGFQAELKRRVEAYFAAHGRSDRGDVRLYAKALLIFGWLAVSYVGLVFFAAAWWHVVLGAGSLGLAMAAVGFNIQHDGSHGSFSRRRWLNRLAASGLDLLGGSSYVWRFQHNVLHHTYTNLTGADHDIDTGGVGRLSPAQPRRWFHRFQHFYLWAAYGVIAFKWQLSDDLVQVLRGRIGPQPMPRPRGWDLVQFVACKLFMVTVAFVIPLWRHPAWIVLAVYVGTMFVLGVVLAVIFQLAHSVQEAGHPEYRDSARLGTEWARHQVETTVDFARGNTLLSWYIGGLNYQVEHHLFPRVAHVHYPAIAQIVEKTSADFGVRYAAHRTFGAALRSHYRFLREMGRPEAAA